MRTEKLRHHDVFGHALNFYQKEAEIFQMRLGEDGRLFAAFCNRLIPFKHVLAFCLDFTQTEQPYQRSSTSSSEYETSKNTEKSSHNGWFNQEMWYSLSKFYAIENSIDLFSFYTVQPKAGSRASFSFSFSLFIHQSILNTILHITLQPKYIRTYHTTQK